MKKALTQRQKIIMVVAAGLALTVAGLSNRLESAPGQVGGTRPAMHYGLGAWDQPSANQYSADQPSDWYGAAQPDDREGFSPSGGLGYPNSAMNQAPSGERGGAGFQSDLGSGAITDGYWNRQASQDGVYRDLDNQITDQVTLQNPTTGETIQADAGSDMYYQSPGADSQIGAPTVVGVDAGATAPSDGTQLSVVTGSEPSPSATSSEGP